MKNSFWSSNFQSDVDRPMLLTVLSIMIVFSVGIVAGRVVTVLFNQVLLSGFAVILAVAWILAYRGNLEVGRIIAPILGFTMIVVLVYRGGVRDTSTLGFSAATLVAGLLLGQFGGLIIGILSTIAIVLIGFSETSGLLDTFLRAYTTPSDVLIIATLMIAATLIQWVLTRRLRHAILNARANEQAQVAANEELRELQTSLEMRVADRTAAVEESARQIEKRAAQLEAISDVSRSIANIQDLDQLLPAITRFISERFGFYHVGIFLLDENREFAELRASNSAGGNIMLKRAHKLRVESSSLVGYAASRSRPRIALDVGADAVFFNNPDLPETRSEIALPLVTGEHVIGVLDVQSTQSGAFSQEDAVVLGTLANQIAIAIENARLFDETRRALAESEQAYQQYIASGWQRAARGAARTGYESSGTVVAPLEKPLQSREVDQAIAQGRVVTISGEAGATLIIPIKMRGQVIGVLNVQNEEQNRSWSVDELTLINAVAERAALALENARLVEDAQRRAAKERLIGDIANKIASASSIQNIVQTAAKELGAALNSSDVTIHFQDTQNR